MFLFSLKWQIDCTNKRGLWRVVLPLVVCLYDFLDQTCAALALYKWIGMGLYYILTSRRKKTNKCVSPKCRNIWFTEINTIQRMSQTDWKKNYFLAFCIPCREGANPHAVHYKLYISFVLFSVMAATPDTGEQFRIKLPGVDSSGV